MVCGYRNIDNAVEQVQNKLRRQGVKVVEVVKYLSSSPPCFYCGCHKECSIGGLYRMMGEAAHSLTITPDMFHRWEDNCETVEAIEEAAVKLRECLTAL